MNQHVSKPGEDDVLVGTNHSLTLGVSPSYMLKYLREQFGLAPEKFIISMADCGNTISSTISIAIKQLHSAGRLRDGHSLALVGFGVGYSWAGTLLRWQELPPAQGAQPNC
jgi:3-oxoacyl-[acyl-carrier-protein] synthase III